MKIFGYEFKKAETNKAKAVDENGNPVEAETVDKDGNPVDKPTLKETAGKVFGTILKIGAIGGAVAGAYAYGGHKVGKEKDVEIGRLQKDNEELSRELHDAWEQIPSETEETSAKEEVETTEF